MQLCVCAYGQKATLSYEVCVGEAGHEIMRDTLTNSAYHLLRMFMLLVSTHLKALAMFSLVL